MKILYESRYKLHSDFLCSFFLKKIAVLMVLFVLLFNGNLFAQTDIKLVILPFSLDSSKPNDKLENKITSMLSEKLGQEDLEVILSDTSEDTFGWTFPQFRQHGIKSGADYILTGSIFMAGQSISIDSKLVNIYQEDNTIPIYVHAENLESLFSATSRLCKGVISEIFHKKLISSIEIQGNKRVETDAIMRIISTQKGDIIKPSDVSKDLRKIYEMGYFDNVVVKQEPLDTGVKLIFELTEKPTVRKVKFKGNTVYEDTELAQSLETKTGSILNIYKLNSDVNRMRLMYTDKNYQNCSITYEIIPLENSQADIVFKIEEGEKIRVEKITFEGNNYFPDKKIKKVMETSEKGFFSFFTSSGDLKETEVQNDVIRIESLYKDNGFIDAKVSDPFIDIGKESISIHFKIEEGDQYKIEEISITGDLIISKEQLMEDIQSKEKALYSREVIRKDILTISDFYANKGFANADVSPLIDKDEQKKIMRIKFSIKKGEPVFFNRVNISGNIKTRDKVIRREIKIVEQDLYSKKNIQKSFKNLNRLNYFDEIDIKPIPTMDKNRMDLDVRITERETGKFSIGGGVSSEDGGFLLASIEERNLFGRGQTLKFGVQLAEESILYDVSYYEPYIMDTAVSGGIQIYKEEEEYDYYDKDSVGLTLKLGYRLFDYTSIGMHYNIEDFEISNVDTDETNMTEGQFFTSSIKPYILYDSRDDLFLPTEGSKHKFSIEYAGELIGGEIDYIKYLAETGIYFPLFWKFTGALHAEMGYLDDRSGDYINIDYIMFYLGGMNSIRGFDKYDINGSRGGEKDRGGEKYLQFNAEMTFPLTEKYKVAVVFFYDRGDVYRTSESIDLMDQYSSFGTGVRWNSPIGPLRIEYAWVIDGKEIKDTGEGQFEFSVGASF